MLGGFNQFNIGFNETREQPSGKSWGNFDMVFDVPGNEKGKHEKELLEAIETNRLYEPLKNYNPALGGKPLRVKSGKQVDLLIADCKAA